ncbi:hypothetical protein D9M72_316090 [compost metagenome]
MSAEPAEHSLEDLEMAQLLVRTCAWHFRKKPDEIISHSCLWGFVSERRTAAQMQAGLRCALDRGWLEARGIDLVLTEAGVKAA